MQILKAHSGMVNQSDKCGSKYIDRCTHILCSINAVAVHKAAIQQVIFSCTLQGNEKNQQDPQVLKQQQ